MLGAKKKTDPYLGLGLFILFLLVVGGYFLTRKTAEHLPGRWVSSATTTQYMDYRGTAGIMGVKVDVTLELEEDGSYEFQCTNVFDIPGQIYAARRVTRYGTWEYSRDNATSISGDLELICVKPEYESRSYINGPWEDYQPDGAQDQPLMFDIGDSRSYRIKSASATEIEIETENYGVLRLERQNIE